MAWRQRSSEVLPRNDQGAVLGPMFDGAQEASGILTESRAVATPELAFEPSAATGEGKDTNMTQDQHIGTSTTASLVGSLADFALADVLALLDATGQTGELQVASGSVAGKLWLVEGELANGEVGTAATIGQVVFELACLSEGEFSFTSGVTVPSSHPPVPVEAVLDEVRPQVDEWREIRRVVPFDAAVVLAPQPPGGDVQIRSDQWQVFTIVGRTGHTIRSVLDEIGGDQMVSLRSLRDLAAGGLIMVGDPTERPSDGDRVHPLVSEVDSVAPITALPLPPEVLPIDSIREGLTVAAPAPVADPALGVAHDQADTLAAVAIMPPPIAGDPWTPVPEPTASDNDGAA